MTEHPQLKTRIKKYEGKGKRITSQLAKKWKKIFFLQPSKKPFRITLFAFLAPDICPLMKEEEALCSIKKLPLFLSQIPLEYTYTSLVCPHTQFVTKLISTLPKRKRGRETSLNSILLSMGRMAKKEEWSFWMDEHFFASFFGNMLCFSNQVPAKLISLPWPVCFLKMKCMWGILKIFRNSFSFGATCAKRQVAQKGGKLVFRILLPWQVRDDGGIYLVHTPKTLIPPPQKFPRIRVKTAISRTEKEIENSFNCNRSVIVRERVFAFANFIFLTAK